MLLGMALLWRFFGPLWHCVLLSHASLLDPFVIPFITRTSVTLASTLAAPLPTAIESPEAIRLANGLTVIHKALPTPVITVDVWLPAGAMAEPVGGEGMAHFLEHLIFKGTERLAPGDFDQLVEAGGGLTNAATSYDYVHYYCCAAADQLPQLLESLAELLLRAAIPEHEFERERQVVLEEIRQYEDEPDSVALSALWAAVYGTHPYGRPILGYVESLEAQSCETLRQFHCEHYRPEQMTLVIAGGIERDRAMALATQCFAASPVERNAAVLAKGQYSESQNVTAESGSASRMRTQAVPQAVKPVPPQVATDLAEGIRRHSLTLPTVEQPRLILAWPGPGIDQAEIAVGLELLSVVLCGGRLARLVQDLREQRRWVQDIDCEYSLLREGGLFTLTAWLEQESLEPVEERIHQHLQQLADCPVKPSELERAQRLLVNDFAFSLETSEQWADLLGYHHTVATLPLAFAYPQQVRQWTSQGLQELAQRYLSPAHYTAMVLLPEGASL